MTICHIFLVVSSTLKVSIFRNKTKPLSPPKMQFKHGKGGDIFSETLFWVCLPKMEFYFMACIIKYRIEVDIFCRSHLSQSVLVVDYFYWQNNFLIRALVLCTSI